MEPCLNRIEVTQGGYLLLPQHQGKGDCPKLLESVRQLWFKLHPNYNEIVYEIETKTKPKSCPLEDLQHFKDLNNKILPVIEDIYKMKDRERFLSKEQKEERNGRITNAQRTNQGKVQSLQRQQEALQREKDEASNFSGEAYNILKSEASLRLVKTLNSIRLIYPVLIKMLTHESKGDKKLSIGKATLDGNKQWLLGDHVFDILTSKNAKHLKQQMALVLKCSWDGSEGEDIFDNSFDWKCLLPKLLQKAKVGSKKPELLKLNKTQLADALVNDKILLRQIEDGRNSPSDASSFQNAVKNLMKRLEYVLGNRFKGCRLEVYGSCLSDLSIGKASDVDVSIYIPKLQEAKDKFEKGELSASKYAGEVKKHIFSVQKKLSDHCNDFSKLIAVTRARVPVIKGCYLNAKNPHTNDGSLDFDICFFNDIAVRNSTLLREYTLVDPRAKNLMLLVKQWAKDQNISSAADDGMSSYAWMILVIFYLQQLGILPNLQCTSLMIKSNFELDANDSSNCINALNTAFIPWNQVQKLKAWAPVKKMKNVPLSLLLHGFFNYMSNGFNSGFYAVSIRCTNFAEVPRAAFKKCSLSFFCIEDPFETIESHCPHNLGDTASLKGKDLILTSLSESAKNLRSILVEEKKIKGSELWHLVTKTKKATVLVDAKKKKTAKVNRKLGRGKSIISRKRRLKQTPKSITGRRRQGQRRKAQEKNAV